MDQFNLAVIRVMTLPESANLSFSKWINAQFPNLNVHSFAIEKQPEGVHDPVSYAKAEPKIIMMLQELAAQDFHGFFVNCAEDPGVKDGRLLVPVPVWGAGSSAACIARSTGLPTGVISLTEEIPPVITEILGSQVVASAVPKGIITAADLAKSPAAILNAAEHCVSNGARCLLLACTAMSILGTADSLRSQLGIPVIDPLLAPLATMQQIYRKTPMYPVS